MLLPPDPSGKNQLAWARDAARFMRYLDNRINNILPSRRRGVEESAPARAQIKPFQIIVTSVAGVGEGAPPVSKIRVIPSTLAGGSSLDLGFSEADDPTYLLSPVEGVLQGGITIDSATGEITSRWLEIVSELTADDDTTFYVEIGTVSQDPETGQWSVTNSRYGPITANICRNWFASAAPYFGVTWL